MAEINKEELMRKAEEAKSEAENAFQDVKEEAYEVVQEARAAVTGQQLESANTVGFKVVRN